MTDSSSPVRLTSNSESGLSLELFSDDDSLPGFSQLTYRATTKGANNLRMLRALQSDTIPVDPYANSDYGT